MLVLRGEGGARVKNEKTRAKKPKKNRARVPIGGRERQVPTLTVHCAKLPIVARVGDGPRWHRRFLPLDTAGRHVLNARKTRRHEAPLHTKKSKGECVLFRKHSLMILDMPPPLSEWYVR